MKTINVRELRNTIPHLAQTLAEEQELVLVSNGQPVARIVPVDAPAPRIESLGWLRQMAGEVPDTTSLIRSERDRRKT